MFFDPWRQRRSRSRSGSTLASRHRQALSPLFVGVLMLTLAACSTGNAAPQARTLSPTPKPTTLPSGTLLYQSDWSNGLEGWNSPPGWKTIPGGVQSDLSDNDTLTVPYKLAVSDYAIEVHFQVVSVPQGGGQFTVSTDRTADKDGYTAGVLGMRSPAAHSQFANAEVISYINPTDDMDSRTIVSDYEPGSIWHTYRIEVQGAQVRFLIDGIGKSNATTTRTAMLSNGPLHLVSSGAIISVSNVRVMVL